VLVCVKSLGMILIWEICSAAFALLVSVTLCAALLLVKSWPAKLRLAGVTLATGNVVTPLPERLTFWGLLGSLSEIESVAASALAGVEGVNLTLIVQDEPPGRVVPQGVAPAGVAEKSAASGGLTLVTPKGRVIEIVDVELFESVTV
jgi:hypothetical protein